MRLMVAAAWEPDLESFRGLMAVEAVQPVLETVGSGVVDAAAGMMQRVMQYRPSHVIFLGTGGASPRSSLTVGDVVVATAARLVDPTVVEGRAALPYAADAVALDAGMIDVLFNAGARLGRIWTPLGIASDDALASKLGALGDVEHLEGYGVARACTLAGVPCAIVLGIANAVGARARDEWRSHRLAAAASAAAVVHAAIRTSTIARSPA